MYLRDDYEVKGFIEPLAAWAKPYTLEHLAEWIASQPPEQEYCYVLSGECLLHQYGAYMGLKDIYGVASVWAQANAKLSKSAGFDVDQRVACGVGCAGRNRWHRTFGHALFRARSILQAEGGSPK